MHLQLHHPGSKQQLEEVWEKQDHMENQEFDPKTFFHFHGTKDIYIITINMITIINVTFRFKRWLFVRIQFKLSIQIWTEMVSGIRTR